MSIFNNQGLLSLTIETGIDLSSATTTHIIYKSPNGTQGTFTNIVVSGTKMIYQFTNADLVSRGTWQFQAYVVIGGRQAWGNMVKQSVDQHL